MSTIDEIEVALELCARRPDRMNFSALKVMIAAALADARREGAEAMRTQLAILTPEMASAACWRYTVQPAGDYARAVSASPLPTSPRQAVLLTDEQIERAVDGHGWTVSELQVEDIPGMARDIESAVLAANGLEAAR